MPGTNSGGGGNIHLPPDASPEQVALARYTEEQQEESLKVEVLKQADDGRGTDLDVTFQAAKGTPYVTVHVQSSKSGEGGKTYDTANFTSETRYDTRRDPKQTVTISRTAGEQYWVWFIPTIDSDGCGNFVLFDGIEGEDQMTQIQALPLPEGPTAKVAFAEVSDITNPGGVDCSSGGEYVIEVNYETAKFDSSVHQVDIRLMADSNDDDAFGQIGIETAVGENGPYSYNTNLTDGTVESTTCGARPIYFEVRVTDGSDVLDSKTTKIVTREWYECANSDCLSARTSTAV